MMDSSRKLVPLTDEIKESSLMNIKTWKNSQSDGIECDDESMSKKIIKKTGEKSEGDKKDKVKDIVSRLNKKKSCKPPNILRRNIQKNLTSMEIENKIKMTKKYEESNPKGNKTDEQNFKTCVDNKTNSSNRIVYNSDKNIDFESLLPGPSNNLQTVPTRKMLSYLKPKFSLKLENDLNALNNCEELFFDPREEQKNLEGELKVFKRGDRFFTELQLTGEQENNLKTEKNIPMCRSIIHISNQNCSMLASKKQRNLPKLNDLSLGNPYGVQLGTRSIKNEAHVLDVIIVAHGISYFKHPGNWNCKDIESILITGAKLYEATKNFPTTHLHQFTKGFVYDDNFIQVTCSEPIVVGKLITVDERSMDLYNALQKFFASYRSAYFTTSKLDLYILAENKGFFVLDPRGRNEKCERKNNREAALMAFTSIDNLYHLIINMSNQSGQASFKICNLKITRVSKKNNVTEELTVQKGNPNVKCRSNEYESLNDHIACLRGSINLGSNIFGSIKNRHGLLSSIFAMLYSKIDPPASWCRTVLDRVMHFAYGTHMECLEGKDSVKNLNLSEIPSKFYIGDSYLAQICIAPYIQRTDVIETRVVFDNPIVEAILNSFQSFNYLILELDNYNFSLWTEDSKFYYFFDGYQKTIEGHADTFVGFSVLFLSNLIDYIIEIIINRMTKISKGSLKIHGLKIINMRMLTREEKKTKIVFKLTKMNCVRPFSVDDVENIKDTPSVVDSITPVFTKRQLQIMSSRVPDKPEHLKITDLNSPLLVCCKSLAYHEIMKSLEKKVSSVRKLEVRNEIKELMHEVQSEIIRRATGARESKFKITLCSSESKKNGKSSSSASIKTDQWSPCGEYLGKVEKVLLQTDLDCLINEREQILASSDHDENETMHSQEQKFSHFQSLPDGAKIVCGTKSLFKITLNKKIYDYENFSILVAVAAILISTKYEITSWSPETIDYVLGCGELMSDIIELQSRMDFYTHDEHVLPKINLNQKFYKVIMSSVINGTFKWLESCLKKLFQTLDRFIIVTNRGSIAIFKENDSFCMFEYSTCNRVGFRVRNEDFGAACLLSFTNIHSLTRRILVNHKDVKENDKFLVYQVNLIENVKSEPVRTKYVSFSPSKENLIIDALRQQRKLIETTVVKNLKENDSKVEEEEKRIEAYRTETGQDVLKNVVFGELSDEGWEKKLNDKQMELNVESFDHQLLPIYTSWCSLEKLGFQKENGDQEATIKGSFGYENRMEIENFSFKRCHFACIYSIMYAVHHDFEKMNYRSVDVILENGLRIFDNIDMDEYLRRMKLNVIVDHMSYELLISEFDKEKKFKESKGLLDNYFTQQKYGILQNIYCSMALVKHSSGFYLFDPYNDEEVSNNKSITPKGSWIRFKSLESVLEYSSKQIATKQDDLKLYQISILSNKKIKLKKAGYYIFNSSEESQKKELNNQESVDEKIEWVMQNCGIPWSRLDNFNFDGLERSQPASKSKEYDVEIEGKLYSLWGNVHPNMKFFEAHAGKQHLPCCIVALIMSHLFPIDEWNSIMLDSIVTCGTKYLINILKHKQEELKIDDMIGICNIFNFKYQVNLQLETFGYLYESKSSKFNLNKALDYTLREKNFNGVLLLCAGRILSIGNYQNKTFFLYDCQSQGRPLFKPSQGTTYVLKCGCLKMLLACIVLTLNIKKHGVEFHLYSVQAKEIN